MLQYIANYIKRFNVNTLIDFAKIKKNSINLFVLR